MVNKIFTTKSAEETGSLGEKIGKDLSSSKGGEIFCLYGELGAGKTTFIQGIAKGLGIEKQVTSPTFILMRTYPLKKGKTFYHLDCYRLENSSQTRNLGLEEIFNDPHNITCIEWAERIKNLLPPKRTDIFFKNTGEDKREIKIITNLSASGGLT